jgi:hypothetical protein
VSEIALSRLDTQWGFNDTTPVEARQVMNLLMQEYQLKSSVCLEVNTLNTFMELVSKHLILAIQLLCRLQLRRALWNTVVNTMLVLYHFKS